MKKKTAYLLLIFSLLVSCKQGPQPHINGDKIREYANELYNRSLYKQAIQQYQVYLDHYGVNPDEQANITYHVANIYFERLNDYENALAGFLKIRTFHPDSKISSNVDKKIIACLERLQRPEDARQALSETADLEPPQRKSFPGTVIAELGDRQITQGDLDHEISQLPPEIRAQFKEKKNKVEFLRRFIATELMYDSAKRQGLDNDKEVQENVFQAKKTFMVQKLLQMRIGETVKIDAHDVELFYKANKDRYAQKDKEGAIIRHIPLEQVRSRVTQDLLKEKQQRAYEELLASYLRAENVKIYDDLVK